MKHGIASSARACAATLCVIASACAHAQAQTSQPAPQAAAASPVFGLGQGLFGLVIVVALIYAAAWVMRRMGAKGTKSGVVQVLGGASVGPREKVVVVRFGSRTLLLGVAPGHVALLQALDASDAPVDMPGAEDATKPRFADRLRAARGDA